MNSYPYFPHFLTDSCVSQHERSPQIKSSNNCEFSANWGNERHALFKGVVNKFGWNSVQQICTQCCWAHGSLSNLAQVRLFSSYRHKWDYIYTCKGTTGHFVSKDLGKVGVICHKINHLHPCSNSSKARVIAGNTSHRWRMVY